MVIRGQTCSWKRATLRRPHFRQRRLFKSGSELRSKQGDTPSRDRFFSATVTEKDGRWRDLRFLNKKLAISIDEEDFEAATSFRDSIETMIEAMTSQERQALELVQVIERSSSMQETVVALQGLVEIGDVSVVPDVAALLHDPHVSQEAEDCLLLLFQRSNDPRIATLMKQGTAALVSQHYVKALSLFESITVIDPNFAEGHNKIATTLYCMKRFEESIQACHVVIDLQPYHYYAWAGMGLCYYHLGKEREAIESMEQALFIHPGLKQIRSMAAMLKEGRLPNV